MSDEHQSPDLAQVFDGEPPEKAAQPEEPAKPEAEAETPEATAEDQPGESEKADEPKPTAKADQAVVPVAVVHELRRELRELKQAATAAAKPPERPDYIDPEGMSHLERTVASTINGQQLRTSRFLAEREFGKDLVDAAYAYFDEHPEQSAALMQHPSPFHAAVEHYQNQRAVQEIGNDPAAYAAKLEADLRAKIEAEMVTKQAKERAGQPAPSMADVTGTGGGPKSTWAGPTPLERVIGS